MSYFINLIVLLLFQITLIKSQTFLKASKGLTDIFYNSTSQNLLFKIPVEEDYPSINNLILNLSYPYRYNRSNCFADCIINKTISTNICYDCKISKTDCDSLDGNKKIIIEEILSPNNCEFENLKSMVSVIYFEKTNIDMVCANYKLSFFVTDDTLENHPYEDIYFKFPVYYKDQMETADCIFPKNKDGKKIACTIDASQRVFEKGYFVNFEYNKTISLTKDLNLTMELEKYVLEDDCGKDMNKVKMISFKACNYIIFLFLFFFI